MITQNNSLEMQSLKNWTSLNGLVSHFSEEKVWAFSSARTSPILMLLPNRQKQIMDLTAKLRKLLENQFIRRNGHFLSPKEESFKQVLGLWTACLQESISEKVKQDIISVIQIHFCFIQSEVLLLQPLILKWQLLKEPFVKRFMEW